MKRKGRIKGIISVVLSLFIFSTVASVNAFAAKPVSATAIKRVTAASLVYSKTVTQTTSNWFASDPSNAGSIESSITNGLNQTTQSYDDGEYRGTLYFTGITFSDQGSYVGSLHKYTFVATFSGTVTCYIPDTKTVSQTTTSWLAVDPSGASAMEASITNGLSQTTRSYDDGIYSGTLSFSGIVFTDEGSYAGTLHKYTFVATFSGTVTRYK
jgi:hypothetical protein